MLEIEFEIRKRRIAANFDLAKRIINGLNADMIDYGEYSSKTTDWVRLYSNPGNNLNMEGKLLVLREINRYLVDNFSDYTNNMSKIEENIAKDISDLIMGAIGKKDRLISMDMLNENLRRLYNMMKTEIKKQRSSLKKLSKSKLKVI